MNFKIKALSLALIFLTSISFAGNGPAGLPDRTRQFWDTIGVQDPLPTDGDSVYKKDIWLAECVVEGWVDVDGAGENIATIPFTNLHTRIANTTATNTKILRIHFNRSVFATQVGLGCTGGGDFSNVVVKLVGSGGTIRTLQDESSDSTKYTSRNVTFPKQLFNAIQLEFHTADDVCLSNITIQKSLFVSVAQVEKTTDSLKVIDYAHAELHSGTHYMVRDWDTIAKNGIKQFVIQTPDTTKWGHLVMGFEAISSKVYVELSEAATTATDGTLVNSRNRNRNYSDNNTILVYEDPTTAVAGANIARYVIGSGRNSGGGARDNEEILLKQNTKYLVSIQEANVLATELNYTIDWYEHTNKD